MTRNLHDASTRSTRSTWLKPTKDTPHGLGTRGRRIDGLRGIRRKVLLDANAPSAVSHAYELGIQEASRDQGHAVCGFETWGAAPNWYYEWAGWGTLMKRDGSRD